MNARLDPSTVETSTARCTAGGVGGAFGGSIANPLLVRIALACVGICVQPNTAHAGKAPGGPRGIIVRTRRAARHDPGVTRVPLARHPGAPRTPVLVTEFLYTSAALLAVVAAVAWLADRLHLSQPIVLVVAGIALEFVPGVPRVDLDPELVLLVLLPPIIYYAAFTMSWQAFRRNLAPILLLAVGCVVATTMVVAIVAEHLLGLPLAVAFMLGAIVSPPDVLAPLAVAQRLGIPRRLSAVLEGEGLVNDVTALILFNLALAAALTGQFSLAGGLRDFVVVLLGETVWGFVVGFIGLHARHLVREPRIEVMISLLTPYLAFWLPHARRRLGRARGGGGGSLHRLGRRDADTREHAAAGAVRLGGGQHGDHRARSSCSPACRRAPSPPGLDTPTLVDLTLAGLADQRRRHRRALRLGVPGDLPAALAARTPARRRAGAELAVSVHHRVHRRARRRQPRRRAQHSRGTRARQGLPGPRSACSSSPSS